MKYLGIDYGRKKIGLAVSDSVIAEPLKTIRYKKEEEVLKKVEQAVKVELVEKVIVGLPEGKIGEEVKKFCLGLSAKLKKYNVEIIEWDESLSTQDAQRLSIEAGIKRKKRKEMEDAYSAALILQSYLDNIQKQKI